jgi:pSer/pThr/pTyr-binding forkhead associated (FHA) protein/RNA polymerase subunit RPABC4/transcription elongation factor Spt4
VTTCTYCGRANEAGAEFCMDCGKPLAAAGAVAKRTSAAKGAGGASGIPATQVAGAAPSASPPPPTPVPSSRADLGTCPFCGGPTSALLPFCPNCGRRLTAPGSGPACARCGSAVQVGTKFCPTCGVPLGEWSPLVRTSSKPAVRTDFRIVLTVLDEGGTAGQRFERKTMDTTIGRLDGDIRFPEDPFLSPLHAKISWENDLLVVRDLGSRNGTWVFLEEPHRLADGDLLLIGSQVIRFRRLGYPGPHSPEADATKRMGSVIPSADIASLTQLRADGSSRDVIQLSPGRDVRIGRENGDWMFPYDPSMSAQHALVRSEDADFVVVDAGSRNGIALAARGDMPLRHRSRILVGDKVLRLELPS